MVADRKGLAGIDDPVYDPSDESTPQPRKATVTVYRVIGSQRCPFTASARWSEYAPDGKEGFMWKKMPYFMLGKCAEALALRKAFPADLSGIYADEEMDQARNAPAEKMEPASTQREQHSAHPMSEGQRKALVSLSNDPSLTPSSRAILTEILQKGASHQEAAQLIRETQAAIDRSNADEAKSGDTRKITQAQAGGCSLWGIKSDGARIRFGHSSPTGAMRAPGPSSGGTTT